MTNSVLDIMKSCLAWEPKIYKGSKTIGIENSPIQITRYISVEGVVYEVTNSDLSDRGWIRLIASKQSFEKHQCLYRHRSSSPDIPFYSIYITDVCNLPTGEVHYAEQNIKTHKHHSTIEYENEHIIDINSDESIFMSSTVCTFDERYVKILRNTYDELVKLAPTGMSFKISGAFDAIDTDVRSVLKQWDV